MVLYFLNTGLDHCIVLFAGWHKIEIHKYLIQACNNNTIKYNNVTMRPEAVLHLGCL